MCVSICLLHFLPTCSACSIENNPPCLSSSGQAMEVQRLVSYAFSCFKCKSDLDEGREEEELGIWWFKRCWCWVVVKHSSESLTWIGMSSWVSWLKENAWLAWLLTVRCEPELAVARRCWWWTFHSCLPVSSEEAVCGTQEHKEEVVRFWYGAH